MTEKRSFKSDVEQSILMSAEALFKIGAIDETCLRAFSKCFIPIADSEQLPSHTSQTDQSIRQT